MQSAADATVRLSAPEKLLPKHDVLCDLHAPTSLPRAMTGRGDAPTHRWQSSGCPISTSVRPRQRVAMRPGRDRRSGIATPDGDAACAVMTGRQSRRASRTDASPFRRCIALASRPPGTGKVDSGTPASEKGSTGGGMRTLPHARRHARRRTTWTLDAHKCERHCWCGRGGGVRPWARSEMLGSLCQSAWRPSVAKLPAITWTRGGQQHDEGCCCGLAARAAHCAAALRSDPWKCAWSAP